MNNKTLADVGFITIALIIGPLAYKRMFEHKSHQDFRKSSSMT
jgi:hypothetical protein